MKNVCKNKNNLNSRREEKKRKKSFYSIIFASKKKLQHLQKLNLEHFYK